MNQEARYRILAQMLEECNPDIPKKITKEQSQYLWAVIHAYANYLGLSRSEVVAFICDLFNIDFIKDLTQDKYQDVLNLLKID